MIGQYDYEGLVEAFLKQKQISGKTAQNRMSFHKDKLYSYQSLLARLRIVNKEKFLYIDTGVSNWSNTSKRHTRILLSSNYLPVRYWNFLFTPEENLEEKLEELEKIIANHNRARKLKPYHISLANSKYEEIEQCVTEHNLDKRTKHYKKYKQIPFKLFAHKMIKE